MSGETQRSETPSIIDKELLTDGGRNTIRLERTMSGDSLVENNGDVIVPLLQDQSVEDEDGVDGQQHPDGGIHNLNEMFGLLWMVLSALAFSLMSLLVNISSTGTMKFPSFQLVLARSVIQMFLSALYMLVFVGRSPFGPKNEPNVRSLLVLRGSAGSVGLSLFYYGLTVMSLSDAIVIFFIGPTLTALLASAVLGEKLEAVDIAASVACLMGVVLVARPNFLFHNTVDHDSSKLMEYSKELGVIALVFGATMSAVAYVTVRKITAISSRVHTMVHVFYFGFISSIFSPICLFLLQKPVLPTSLSQWLVLVAVGVLAFIGQILLNRGLQLAPAGPGTVMRNLDIVFAFLFDTLLLHKRPKWTSYVGASIILVFTCAVGLKRYFRRRNQIERTNN